jgi:hypothetical protein
MAATMAATVAAIAARPREPHCASCTLSQIDAQRSVCAALAPRPGDGDTFKPKSYSTLDRNYSRRDESKNERRGEGSQGLEKIRDFFATICSNF